MYDVIVVGARCAGSATALLLARKGFQVLLVDRVGFPSDTLSTHFIHLSGVAALERWGLLDCVRATGCPPIRELRLDVGPFALSGRPPAAGAVDEMFCCRRTVLDKLLVDAAVEAGAELRQGCVVEELLRDDTGAVCGVRGRDGAGSVSERTALVIGADGRHSMVAKAVQAPEYEAVPPLSCAYYSYWSGMECDRAELYARPGRGIVAPRPCQRSTRHRHRRKSSVCHGAPRIWCVSRCGGRPVDPIGTAALGGVRSGDVSLRLITADTPCRFAHSDRLQ